MKNKIIITSAIFASLFLSACETASQRALNSSSSSTSKSLFAQAKQTAADKLESKLNSWSSIRGWKNNYNDTMSIEIKDYNNIEHYLTKACKQETKQAVEKLPKFKVKHDLDLLEEQAKNVLYSGRDIKDVWSHLGQTFKTSGIPVAAPKQFLQLESK